VLQTIHGVKLVAISWVASNGLLVINPPWLTLGDFIQHFVGITAFHVAEIEGITAEEKHRKPQSG
jgi:hypothetical protein